MPPHTICYALQKTYVASASILIKPDSNKGNTPDELLARRMNVESGLDAQMTNEMLSLKSVTITRAVAERLNLDVEYTHKGMFHPKVNIWFRITCKDGVSQYQ